VWSLEHFTIVCPSTKFSSHNLKEKGKTYTHDLEIEITSDCFCLDPEAFDANDLAKQDD